MYVELHDKLFSFFMCIQYLKIRFFLSWEICLHFNLQILFFRLIHTKKFQPSLEVLQSTSGYFQLAFYPMVHLNWDSFSKCSWNSFSKCSPFKSGSNFQKEVHFLWKLCLTPFGAVLKHAWHATFWICSTILTFSIVFNGGLALGIVFFEVI